MSFVSTTGGVLGRVVRVMNRAGLVLACGALVFQTLSISYEVVARYFFNSPTKWAFEGSQIALAFSIFLAAGYILERERHVRMDLLTGRLKEKARSALFLAVYPMGLAYAAVIFYSSVLGVKWSLDIGARTVVLGLPRAFPGSVLAAGGLLLCLSFALRWVQLLLVVLGRGSAHSSGEGGH